MTSERPAHVRLIPKLRGGVAFVFVLFIMTGPGHPASAETLEQALADAYLINPVLNAERARLRATDEQVALAKSGLRPFISSSADYAFQNTDNDVSRPPGTTSLGKPSRHRLRRWIPHGH